MNADPHAGKSHVIHWARLYDLGTALSGRHLRRVHERVLEQAHFRAGERALDVGCGPGRMTIAAASAVGPTGEVLGIDPSPEMIALARKNARRQGSAVRFEAATMQDIPAAHGYFDVALACLVVHHVPEELQEKGFQEARRVLRPDGRLVILDFAAKPGHGFSHVLSVMGFKRGFDNAERLKSLAEAAGFYDIQVQTSGRAFCLLSARRA